MNASRRRSSAARIRRANTAVAPADSKTPNSTSDLDPITEDNQQTLQKESNQDIKNFTSNIEEITDLESGISPTSKNSQEDPSLLDVDLAVEKEVLNIKRNVSKKKLRRKTTMKYTANKYVMNLHEATTYFALGRKQGRASEQHPQRYFYCCASFFLVVLQFGAMAAIMVSLYAPTCADSSSCPSGKWCSPRIDTCVRCVPQYEKLCINDKIANNVTHNNGEKGSKGALNWDKLAFMCDNCFNHDVNNDISQDTLTSSWTLKERFSKNKLKLLKECPKTSKIYHYRKKMKDPKPDDPKPDGPCLDYKDEAKALSEAVLKFRLIDYMVSFFSLGVVAFTMVRELKDVKVNELQIKQFSASTLSEEEKEKNKYWKGGLYVLMWARQHVLIPMLVGAQADMIVYRGGDAIGILTNTVSLVVILDMDEMAFWNALPTRVHNYFETTGVISLSRKKQLSMERANAIYIILIPLSVLAILLGYGLQYKGMYLITIVAFPFFGQLCEVFFLSGILEGKKFNKETIGRLDLVLMSCFFGCLAVLATMAGLEVLYQDIVSETPTLEKTLAEKFLFMF